MKEEYLELHNVNMVANYAAEPRGSGTGRGAESVVIRELPHTKQREYEAVRQAIELTERYRNGKERLYIIQLVFWDKSHTLEGAALMVPCSIASAWRWHGEFIRTVASCYGLMDD